MSLMKERYPMNGKTDNFVVYLIGTLYYELNDVEKCTQYLSRIVGNQEIRHSEPEVYNKAQNLWLDIREAQEKEGKA